MQDDVKPEQAGVGVGGVRGDAKRGVGAGSESGRGGGADQHEVFGMEGRVSGGGEGAEEFSQEG